MLEPSRLRSTLSFTFFLDELFSDLRSAVSDSSGYGTRNSSRFILIIWGTASTFWNSGWLALSLLGWFYFVFFLISITAGVISRFEIGYLSAAYLVYRSKSAVCTIYLLFSSLLRISSFVLSFFSIICFSRLTNIRITKSFTIHCVRTHCFSLFVAFGHPWNQQACQSPSACACETELAYWAVDRTVSALVKHLQSNKTFN